MHLVRGINDAAKMISKGFFVKSKDKDRYFAGYLVKVDKPYVYFTPGKDKLRKYKWDNHKFYYESPVNTVAPKKGGQLKPTDIKGNVQVVSLIKGESRKPKSIKVKSVKSGKVVDFKGVEYPLYKHAFYK